METLFAYLDPGTGSLLLQALVAGFAGLSVAGKFGWRWVRGQMLEAEPLSVGEASHDAIPVVGPPSRDGVSRN